jgi:pimeloyl-ACP methyl ester carboxylesterase
MGASGSMDWWPTEFCELLAAGDRLVVRYDLRDTGESTTYPPGQPDYTGDDLVLDAIGSLDALEIERAHLVGLSLGGALAQVIAIEHPGRVESLTLVATSPGGPSEPDLPGMSDQARALFGGIAQPDWTDRAAVIDYMTQLERACGAPSAPFDEASARELAGTVFDRTSDIESSYTNHHRVDGPDGWRGRLGEIGVPTLVIHGDEDPLFALEHGEAMAREIPNAELLVLEGVGHELPRPAWHVAIPAILELTASS